MRGAVDQVPAYNQIIASQHQERSRMYKSKENR